MAIILPIVSNFNKKGITDASAALSALGDSLKRIGAQAAFASFMSSSINQAKDLQRNMAALDGVFGSYAGRMRQFAADAKTFGLSQTEAARTSVFLGSVLKSAGFGMEEVSVKTKELTVLAQDLATTYGYDTQEALTAMTALFRGEYDPIEKFGVALKQNEVNALLAAKGLSNLTGQALLNAQQQIRMEQLFLRTNDAQGAYARQSDSLFVSQQNLSAAFKNLQANAAQPLTIALGKLFANMVPLVENAGPGLTNTFTQFADIILTLAPLLNPLASLIGALGSEFNLLTSALSGLIKPFIEPLVNIIYGLTSVLTGLFGWINQNASALVVWGIAIGVTVGVVKTLIAAWEAYKIVVAAAAAAQALLDIAMGAVNPAALAIGIAVLAAGVTGVAIAASNAKFNVEGLNAALQKTANTSIPKLDFSGGAPVGLNPSAVKNPMDGAVTTWFSGGQWYTAEFKNGKWTTPKLYKAPTKTGTSGGGAKQAPTDYVKEFYKNLKDEMEKQSARLKLEKLGASQAFIESVVGSGSDWKKVFASIAAKGKAGVAELQRQFNKTSAGIKEIADANEAAAKAAQDAYDEAVKAYEKLKEVYDKQVEAINSLKKSLKDAASAVSPLAVATREIGQFEQAVIDSFSNIVDTINQGLADGTLLKDAAQELIDYARKEQVTIQDLMRQRDELVNRRSLAQSLMDDIKSTIMSMGNVTELLAKNTTDVTETITKMVGNVQVATSRVIKGVTGGSAGLITSFKDTLAKTKEFAQQLKDLRALGLDKNIYQQIVTAGIDAGGATAKAILEGGTGTVSELNGLFAELDAVGADIAEQSGQVMYGAGIDLVDGLINGMISKEKSLVEYAQQLADTFTSAFAEKMNLALPMPTAPIAPALASVSQTMSVNSALLDTYALARDLAGSAADYYSSSESIRFANLAQKNNVPINITVNAGLGTDGKIVGQTIQSYINQYNKANSSF